MAGLTSHVAGLTCMIHYISGMMRGLSYSNKSCFSTGILKQLLEVGTIVGSWNNCWKLEQLLEGGTIVGSWNKCHLLEKFINYFSNGSSRKRKLMFRNLQDCLKKFPAIALEMSV